MLASMDRERKFTVRWPNSQHEALHVGAQASGHSANSLVKAAVARLLADMGDDTEAVCAWLDGYVDGTPGADQ